jgi:hypothetical protein
MAAPDAIISNFIAQLNRIDAVRKKWDAYNKKYYPGCQDDTPLFCFMLDLIKEIQEACDAFETAIDTMTQVFHQPKEDPY